MTETFINHCITLYNALDDRAKIHKLKDDSEARVFAGNYTDVFKATGLSRTYYSSTRRALENHNAILILQRGSKGSDTVIVLRGLPETWEVDGWNDGQPVRKGLTTDPRYATLVAEVEEQKKRTGGINVVKALAEFQERVIALETQVAQHEAKIDNLQAQINTKEK